MKVRPQENETTESPDEELTAEELALYGNEMPGENDDDEASSVDDVDTKEKEEVIEEDATEEKEEAPEFEPEENEGIEPKEKTNGREGWELDDYKKAYENLEKVIGKQGEELGEARKEEPKEEKKEYTINDVPEMDDPTLGNYLIAYETELSSPTLEYEDPDRYKLLMKEYDLLKEERAVRKAMSRIHEREAKKAFSTFKDVFKTKYDLSDEEMAAVTTKASRLSDEGIPTREDLEAALYRLNPQKLKASISDEVTQRITKAKSKEVPRIPLGSDHEQPKGLSPKDFMKLSGFEQERYLNDCSVDEVDRLLEEINK